MDRSDAADETKLRLRPNRLDWLDVDDEVIALDTAQGVYHGANPSGAILWRELAKGTTRHRLIAVLVAHYELDQPTAERDVDAFLETVAAKGLLEQP